MTRRAGSTAATFARYLVLQLPGSVIAATLLALLVHTELISSGIAYGLFALWIAGEILMFPVMRIAYEPGDTHTGIEAMIGSVGETEDDIDPEGHVRVGAERWHAMTEGGRIAMGSAVRVRDVRGLTIVVERLTDSPEPNDGISDRRDG
jgi:membrane-bound ClpP family serine protease